MRGYYPNHNETTGAVEQAVALRKEQAELRLARITNGAEPDQKNGPPVKKNKCCGGRCKSAS